MWSEILPGPDPNNSSYSATKYTGMLRCCYEDGGNTAFYIVVKRWKDHKNDSLFQTASHTAGIWESFIIIILGFMPTL